MIFSSNEIGDPYYEFFRYFERRDDFPCWYDKQVTKMASSLNTTMSSEAEIVFDSRNALSVAKHSCVNMIAFIKALWVDSETINSLVELTKDTQRMVADITKAIRVRDSVTHMYTLVFSSLTEDISEIKCMASSAADDKYGPMRSSSSEDETDTPQPSCSALSAMYAPDEASLLKGLTGAEVLRYRMWILTNGTDSARFQQYRESLYKYYTTTGSLSELDIPQIVTLKCGKFGFLYITCFLLTYNSL